MTRPHTQPQIHGSTRVWTLATGPLQENAVIVAGTQNEGFLFDPGDEADKVLAWVQASGITVRGILLTHAHFDHIGAVQPVREALGVPVYLHPADLPVYALGAASAARWNLPFIQPGAPEHGIAQGQTFTAGDLTLTAREVPGHAPGHVVFVDAASGVVVAGDTLFRGSIGRTDLPGGNHAQLLAGIAQELLTLPDEAAVYPGHGPATTIGFERRTNPFLQ
jgi:hydroxyacylglutathione hydrolase